MKVGEEFVRDYLDAVGDRYSLYASHGLVPPVALAARTLGSLLERLELPPGAIHSLQEITAIRPVTFGQEITGAAEVSQPRRRAGMEFITATIFLRDRDGREAFRGQSTVIAQDPTHAAGESPVGEKASPSSHSTHAAAEGPKTEKVSPSSVSTHAAGEGSVGEKASPSSHSKPAAESEGAGAIDLPAVVKTITHEQLRLYAQVSGDQNPLHLDPGFAATTQFGGIIAHGMLTLAFISEVMTKAFGKAWLQSGAMRVRFKGAAYPGRAVEAGGKVNKDEQSPGGRRLGCIVGVRDHQDGQELVSGTATVSL